MKKIFAVALIIFSALVVEAQCQEKYIDLHLHLDGAITPGIAKELAALQNITLPVSNDQELEKLLTLPEDSQNLNDFLKCFEFPLSLLQTPEGLRAAVRLVANEIQSQGVIYAEFHYAPQLHTQKGMTQEDAVKAALEGLKDSKLKANLILCLMRGSDNDAENYQTLELARKYLVKDGGVVGLDLAGAESLYPTQNYEAIFTKAREYKIPFTIHVGEDDGPDSIRAALSFGANRIGHGVRAYEDPEVVELIKNSGVFLGLCPTSNRMTHTVPDMSKYPLMDYFYQGIKVTVNTDDPAIEGTTLHEEFEYLKHEFGLKDSQKFIMLENSIEAAFTTDEVKEWLRREIF